MGRYFSLLGAVAAGAVLALVWPSPAGVALTAWALGIHMMALTR